MEEQQKWVSVNNGEYLYIPKFFSKIEGNDLLDDLLTNIEWKQESKTMYGKETISPRLEAIYGDTKTSYSYDGKMITPHAWTESILAIKQKIKSLLDDEFNNVILNQFRNEKDSIYWYTDAGNELGQDPTVVYVNFGATRKFQFRHRSKKGSFDLNLTHGSILVTKGEMQHFWVHQLAKPKKKTKEYINLTFRTIK
ncbi:alpha-ketoglutarate-dependent dioxygenase AlkB family protein [Labilibacter marinus]|uniref:alpha-ketoglutarate-dependent dioxygenase AlkB family protein n=1 Tax=Labilibacter marinus TaxID=1477105 RepID=UPI00094FC54D|nr:alpha-ketoglutarate-dependent dioxygenase AlkB [Labilibacter marinus]